MSAESRLAFGNKSVLANNASEEDVAWVVAAGTSITWAAVVRPFRR